MPRLQQSEAVARAACSKVMTIDGVCEARANPTIGSLLILYDRQRLTPTRLWDALRERDIVSGSRPFADDGGVTRITLSQTESAGGEEVLAAVRRFATEKLLAHFATALIGAVI